MPTQILRIPDSPEVMANEKHPLAWHFAIKRVPLQSGYEVLFQEGEKKFYAEMDFSTRFQKLILRDPETESSAKAVCYMRWASRKIHIGAHDLNECQQMEWDEVEKKTKNMTDLTWQGIRREEYEWGEHLLWTTKRTWPTKCQSYTLLDQRAGKIIAEFHRDKNLYMGGILKIQNTGSDFGAFDLKVLMTFLAIFEVKRRKCHHVVYRPSKGNKAYGLYYQFLKFLHQSVETTA